MSNPWLAIPAAPAPLAPVMPGPRRLVRESWHRSTLHHLDPDNLLAPLAFDEAELRDHRLSHPLAGVLPVIRKLLVQDADDDSGILVAVGDAMGRLLWIDGDRHLRRLAEGMLFVEGAAWSERDVGTSAPGTALELDHGIQIHAAEHFNRLVHPWSCTAVPVHDPESGRIIGVIDITGGAQAVAAHALPLMEATAAAVESEILVQRLRAGAAAPPGGRASSRSSRSTSTTARGTRSAATSTSAASRPQRGTLQILGRSTGLLTAASLDTAVPNALSPNAPRSTGSNPNGPSPSPSALSPRHAEILTLLAWHQQGLSADRLTDLLYEADEAPVTLRAELVRLRKVLGRLAPSLVPESRPYRLPIALELDVHQVLSLLDRGAHRAALAAYPGPVLPESVAPGIVDLRTTVAGRLRESILSDASGDVLFQYATTVAAPDDTDVLLACLRLLPPRSPKRAGLVERIESINASL
ncbi:GAF domain-containing protein [Plantibacter sp. Mn2098]|uniref:GAF domain-containing protein n=1 Tax=Plantibacter sp. Mn2098 TaxID=3395266 RepID=UPI003BC3C0FD